jgi:antitoxin (DNA-binding transcriptional repressor) of toxin-antitoxin stability system
MGRIVTVEDYTELLSLIEGLGPGEDLIITRDGREVARLVASPDRADDIVEQFRRARQGATLGNISIRDLIDEGRR